ncbi:ESX secretion-associated protein EspG [Kutzneria sp. NPDC052558]|uniref:ESX secretion-associated protein EspG n=1 Tax=Kutzneria sp. NPDC052558 TaxID=3364121 RepID=UPI0037C8B493
MLRDRVELPADVLTTVLRWEGIDRPHTVLAVTALWMDDDTRREVDRKVLAELANRGLADGRGVDAGFRATMGAIARPAVEFYGWISTGPDMTGVLAVASGSEAVLIIRHDETVTLYAARPDSLAEAVVAQLPAVPPAHGRSLNVPETDLSGARPAQDSDEGFAGFGSQTGPSTDVKLFNTLMNEPRTATSQLYVAVRDGLGRRVRATHNLSVIDVAPGRSAEGRWMTQEATNGAGGNWVYAAPANPQALTAKLYEMVRALSGVR